MQSIGAVSGYSNYQGWHVGRASAEKVGFSDVLNPLEGDSVLKEFEDYFGMKIDVTSVDKGHKNVTKYATGSGASPIAIAPNILEEMANNPELKQRIKQTLQFHFDSVPNGRAFLASKGLELKASGAIVHEDGTVSTWSISEESPEKKEQIRKQMEAEAKEKQERKQAFEDASAEYREQVRISFNLVV
ncbi:MAG: DUF6033 family protein [Desulfobacter sp.]